jgi:hypothetical protein
MAVLAVLAAAACDKSSTGPETPTMATIELRNNNSAPIVTVNISSCSEAVWGANRLNQDESIATGATRTWSMPPGCYDVRASTGTKSGIWYDREAVAGEFLRLALPESASSLLSTADGVSWLKAGR